MQGELPEFDAPPVVETVLGVQFAPIAGFTTAHAGWFWKSVLPEEWSSVREVVRLEDQFEQFEPHALWQPGGRFRITPGPECQRIHIIRRDQERLLQIQDSRFIYNWQRKTGPYPTYKVIRPEFDERFGQYREFVRSAGLGELTPNQWEVTYVNHIPKGELWKEVAAWDRVLPNTVIRQVNGCQMQSMSAEWHVIIGENKGRLHIQLQHGQRSEDVELMVLKLTARGPIDPMTLGEGLDLGHGSIVNAFAAITSPEAHGFWKRTR